MRIRLESLALGLPLIAFGVAALTVGCGDGNVLQSATGPSATLDPTTFLTADAPDGVGTTLGAGEFGTLKGINSSSGGKDKDKDKSKDTDSSTGNPEHDRGKKPAAGGGPGRSHQDRVVGFISAKFGDILTINGVAVVARTDAVIRHGNRTLTVSDLEVGDHVQARGTMAGTTLVATEIKVQDTGNDNDVEQPELAGTISALSSTANCPVVTFTIGATRVTTSLATVFDDVTCATLANNAFIEVEGTRQPDGSILATKVEAGAGPDEVEGTAFEFPGAGSAVALPLLASLHRFTPRMDNLRR